MGFLKDVAGAVANAALDAVIENGSSEEARQGEGGTLDKLLRAYETYNDSFFWFESTRGEFSKLAIDALLGAFGCDPDIEMTIVKKVRRNDDNFDARGRATLTAMMPILLEDDIASEELREAYADLFERLSERGPSEDAADEGVVAIFDEADEFWVLMLGGMGGCWKLDPHYGLTPGEYAGIIGRYSQDLTETARTALANLVSEFDGSWDAVRAALGMPMGGVEDAPASQEVQALGEGASPDAAAADVDFAAYIEDPEVDPPAERLLAQTDAFDPALTTFWPAGVDTGRVSETYLVAEGDALADSYAVAPTFNGTLYDAYRAFNMVAEDEGLAWRARYRMFQAADFFCLEFANLTGNDWARYYLVMYALNGGTGVEVYKHPAAPPSADEREWAKTIRLAVKRVLGASPFNAEETMVASY